MLNEIEFVVAFTLFEYFALQFFAREQNRAMGRGFTVSRQDRRMVLSSCGVLCAMVCFAMFFPK